MSSALRLLSNNARVVARAPRATAPIRAFHSPFAALGSSPISSSSRSHLAAAYEKQADHSPEVLHGSRTYVVSEPDTTSKFYSVPSGAYPVSSPYANFATTEASNSSQFQRTRSQE
ncbi:hypothetical protein DXG03_008600 [Asterophora parasitica]|uniref:Uncharacterized protein n=1 Tax=Asterophora parasitica TaxID=117018 RepID=A0A9P7G5C9_9AGAR|nr:hypothetical protein DXG03_008600 [Asterophora parasitica]